MPALPMPRNPSALTVEDLRRLTNWCDNQHEDLWLPPGRPPLTLAQILACYHAANDADYIDFQAYLEEQPDAARAVWEMPPSDPFARYARNPL